MEADLNDLIKKYNLDEFIELFENGGVKCPADIIDIDHNKLRSYYHMLDADINKFEKLRSECIKKCRQPQPLTPSVIPTTSVIPLSQPIEVEDNSTAISPHIEGHAFLPEVLCDYNSGQPAAEVKMKEGIPHILLLDNHSHYPVIPRYDLTPVNGYRGLGFIIVNANFDHSRISYRNGADEDLKMLTGLFVKMKLQLKILKDHQRNECLEVFKTEIERMDYYTKIIFIAVSSYGEDDKFLCKDGSAIQIQEIVDILRSPTLINIPKILLIQTCGNIKMANTSQIVESPHALLKKESDILIVYSSVPGYVANIYPEQGSWFIQSLLKAYDQLHEHADFQQILTYTNNLMETANPCEVYGVTYKQPFQTVSTLQKLIYL